MVGLNVCMYICDVYENKKVINYHYTILKLLCTTGVEMHANTFLALYLNFETIVGVVAIKFRSF